MHVNSDQDIGEEFEKLHSSLPLLPDLDDDEHSQESGDQISNVDSAQNCGCKPSVLCVDDNSFNLEPLTQMIKKNFNLVPDEALNGEDAVSMYKEKLAKECLCRDRSYKLIIMDVQMPGIGGEEASRQIL